MTPAGIVTGGLPLHGQVGRPYVGRMRTSAPFPFALCHASLPPGLTLEEDGRIAGTPTEAGTWLFGVETGPHRASFTITVFWA